MEREEDKQERELRVGINVQRDYNGLKHGHKNILSDVFPWVTKIINA